MASVKKWDIFEVELHGPDDGNPFMEVELNAVFRNYNREIKVSGFYDGEGIYKVRFMPDYEGKWEYETLSNRKELSGKKGSFICEGVDSHGPVVVDSGFDKGLIFSTRFAYADGTPYICVGTTCYVWNLQEDSLRKQTLETLASSPFNKIRFCVFPKHFIFNNNDPVCFPYEGSKEAGFDYERFNPEYFRLLENCILDLRELNIEADLILFHPYDYGEWGFDRLPREVNVRLIKYLCARISSCRNLWWSLSNEYNLIPYKNLKDWDCFFKTLVQNDPYDHLRSIHNGGEFYDHAKGYVTHVSVSYDDVSRVSEWIKKYGKLVVVDECNYEGNISDPWGSITPQEMVNRIWMGFSRGGFVGHGETYLHPYDILWWSKGGKLYGESPTRIAFLRKYFEAMPGKLMSPMIGAHYGEHSRIGEDMLLYYLEKQHAKRKEFTLPEGKKYKAELVDAWNMTVTPIRGIWEGKCMVPLSGQPYCAVKFTRVD